MKVIVIVTGIVFLFLGCEKESIDYRDKYCGEWYFTTIIRSFSMENESSSHDTIYYDGLIWYENKDSIIIEYRENRVLEFEINDSGEIFIDRYYPTHGEFIDENNVNFNLYSGGLGGGTGESVSGIRK